jgi:prepilin-type N-terminal cleavage/methylation domain-containing protein
MRRRAFTLVELLTVLAILSILVTIAIPNFMKYRLKSIQSEAKVHLKGIYTAKSAYYANHGTYACGACNYRIDGSTAYSYKWGGAAVDVAGAYGCDGGNAAQAFDAFTALAGGNVDTDTFCDVWKIDHLGVGANLTNDVSLF